MRTFLLLTAPVVLLAAGEALPNGTLDPIARLGAVATLSFLVIWHATRTQPATWRKLDHWEKVRHEDSEKLRRALETLATSCKDAVARLDQRKS